MNSGSKSKFIFIMQCMTMFLVFSLVIPLNIQAQENLEILLIGETVQVDAAPGLVHDWQFEGNVEDIATVTILTTMNGLELSIYGPDDFRIFHEFIDSGQPEFAITLEQSGIHYIRVEQIGNGSHGIFDILLNQYSSSDYQPLLSIDRVPEGATRIDVTPDIGSYWRIEANANDTIIITATTDVDFLWAEIYDAEGELIDTEPTRSGEIVLEFTFGEMGNYLLLFDQKTANPVSGFYELTFNQYNPEELAAAQATPAPERDVSFATGDVIFAEDFSDNRAGWYIYEGSSQRQVIVGGQYVFEYRGPDGVFAEPGEADGSDRVAIQEPFEMQFELSGVDASEDEYYFLIAFNIESKSSSPFRFEIYSDGTWAYFAADNIFRGETDFRFNPNLTHTVRVQVTENAQRLYIDDTLIAHVPGHDIDGTFLLAMLQRDENARSGIGSHSIRLGFTLDNLFIRRLSDDEITSMPESRFGQVDARELTDDALDLTQEYVDAALEFGLHYPESWTIYPIEDNPRQFVLSNKANINPASDLADGEIRILFQPQIREASESLNERLQHVLTNNSNFDSSEIINFDIGGKIIATSELRLGTDTSNGAFMYTEYNNALDMLGWAIADSPQVWDEMRGTVYSIIGSLYEPDYEALAAARPVVELSEDVSELTYNPLSLSLAEGWIVGIPSGFADGMLPGVPDPIDIMAGVFSNSAAFYGPLENDNDSAIVVFIAPLTGTQAGTVLTLPSVAGWENETLRPVNINGRLGAVMEGGTFPLFPGSSVAFVVIELESGQSFVVMGINYFGEITEEQLSYLYTFAASIQTQRTAVVTNTQQPTATGPTLTPTITLTPSRTPTPTDTLTPSNTPLPSNTPTATTTATITPLPTNTPIPTATIDPENLCRIVARNETNVRNGAGTNFGTIVQLSAGQEFEVVAYDEDVSGFLWWQLISGGWVRSDVVDTHGDCSAIIAVVAGTQIFTTPDELHVGGTARVYVEDDGLSLRSGAGVNFALLEKLPAGTLVEILDGPVAADGYVWWQIRAPSGREGWSVERADNLMTLIPIS